LESGRESLIMRDGETIGEGEESSRLGMLGGAEERVALRTEERGS
jgi:hypothetical protein